MKESSRLRGLYAITDSKLLADGRLLPYVEAALKAAPACCSIETRPATKRGGCARPMRCRSSAPATVLS